MRNLYYGFIRVHVLYHATEGKICGIDIIEELKRHGYKVSPGTIYPILHKMTEDRILTHNIEIVNGKRRIYYRVTSKGKKLLELAQVKIKELYDEVILNEK